MHFLHRAHASIQVEASAGLFPDYSQSRPADILLQNWNLGRLVALDISVVSPLNPSTLAEAGATFGAVLEATKTYGAWGKEVSLFFLHKLLLGLQSTSPCQSHRLHSTCSPT